MSHASGRSVPWHRLEPVFTRSAVPRHVCDDRLVNRPTPTEKLLEAHLRGTIAAREKAGVNPHPDWRYRCTEDLVLKAGRPYRSMILTRREREVVSDTITKFHKMRFLFEFNHCYYNAQWLMRLGHDLGLNYVEGYCMDAATATKWPHLHGWVTINDKVIDPTVASLEMVKNGQKEPDLILGSFPTRAYWGLPFNRKYVMDRSGVGHDFVGLLDTDWERGWPLHREGVGPAHPRGRRRTA